MGTDNDSLKVPTGGGISKQVGEAERCSIGADTVNFPTLIDGEACRMGGVKMSFPQNVITATLRVKRAGPDANDQVSDPAFGTATEHGVKLLGGTAIESIRWSTGAWFSIASAGNENARVAGEGGPGTVGVCEIGLRKRWSHGI